MKKFLGITLIVCLLFVGCTKNNNKETDISANELKKDEKILTVGTYNIDPNSESKPEDKRMLMEKNNVDIFGAQEVDIKTIRNNIDITKEFKKEPYKDIYFSNAIDFQKGKFGNAVVSKFKFKESETFKLVGEERNGEDLSKRFREVYNNYNPENLESKEALNAIYDENPIEPRVLQRVVFEFEGKDIVFYNTHLSWENTELRKEQLEFIKEKLDNDPVKYKILTGDFNVDQSIDELDMFKKDYNLSNGKDGVFFDTFNGEDDAMKVFSIDNIIVSNNIEIKTVNVIKEKLSDHYPLVAELILK